MTDEAKPKEGPSSEEKLRQWRVGQFVRLGFSETSAELLADSPVDLHYAEDMVKHGCDLSVALRILI